MFISYFAVLFAYALFIVCQSSTLVVNVVEVGSNGDITLVCNVSSSTNLTRWAYLSGPSGTSLMSYQNGSCTVSPSDSILSNSSRYSYTCSNTVHQVTLLPYLGRYINNHILACRDAVQPDGTGSTWMINIIQDGAQCNCDPKITFNVRHLTEGENVTFICRVSSDVPYVNWNMNFGLNTAAMGIQNGQCVTQGITFLDNTSRYTYTCNRTVYQVTRLNVLRSEYNDMFMCTPFGQADGTGSNWIVIVKDKAEYPYISQSQGNEYRLLEDTSGTLSCTIKGGNPIPTLSWSCDKLSATNQTTINSNGNVTKTLTWNVSRTQEGRCTCTSTQTSFTTATLDVALVVLYPPSKPMFRVYGGSVVGDILFIEGNTRSIKCTADSKPSPDKYTWTGPKITGTVDIQSVTFSNIRKTDAGEYKCSVHNTMNPSNGNALTGINSRAVNVAVLYPPSALYFVYGNLSGQNISINVIDVMKGDTFDIVCKSIDGNPSPMFKWYDRNDNGPVLRVNNIQESRTNATCTATNYMKETNREVVNGNVSDTIRFNILVRPTINKCEWYYNANPTDVTAFRNDNIDTLMIMENESFTLKCSAEGKPTPNVWWNTPQRSLISSSSVTVDNLTRHMTGDYVYTANSLLKPSFKGKYKVTVSKTVSVHVLYPPAILPMNDIAKLEDEQLNVMCNYTAGMPETTSIKWTRDIDNIVWSSTILNIESLKRSDAGMYTCTASNIMKQSVDSKAYIGQHNQSFHLDVQYAASIRSFTIYGITSRVVTVNESDQIRLLCNADSNPTAVMTLRHESNLLVTEASNTIIYDIPEARCLDTGIFYCSARNVHHESTDIMQLYVNCYPRTEHEVEMFVKSANNERMSITFKAIAYPPPIFTWFRLVQDNWMELENDDNYFIQSTDLQSTLIIVNVGVDDFTSYKVIAENKLGSIEQVYVLSPYDTAFPSSTPGALIGGIVGGVTGCIVTAVVIFLVIRRYSLCKVCGEQLSRDKSEGSNNSAEEQAYYNTGRLEDITNENNDATAYDEIGSVNNYEMVKLNTGESKPYSTLDETEQRTTSDTNNEDNRAVYENMKIQVF